MSSLRKKTFVHGSIQGALVLRMLVQWLAFVVALTSVVVLMQLVIDPLQDAESWRRQVKTTLLALGLVSFALLPIFVWDIIKFSHRFVGPIVRLHSHVRELDDGCESRLTFRANDYWLDLADDFNAMMDRVREKPLHKQEEPDVVSAEHS